MTSRPIYCADSTLWAPESSSLVVVPGDPQPGSVLPCSSQQTVQQALRMHKALACSRHLWRWAQCWQWQSV